MSCCRPSPRGTRRPCNGGCTSWWRRSSCTSGGCRRRRRTCFKHALIQDAAYQSLLRSTRQQYHQHIAQVLEAALSRDLRDPARAAGPSLHRGGPQRAGHPLLAAGGPARPRALGPCWKPSRTSPRGWRYLQRSRTPPSTLQQELDLQLALGPALMVTKGLAAPEVEQAYARARELCQQVGETPQLFPVLWGLWRFYTDAAELPDGAGAGGAAPHPGPACRRPGAPPGGPPCAGSTLYLGGELAAAQAHLEQGIALYDPQQHRSHALLYGGHDPGCVAAPMRPDPCGSSAIQTRPCRACQRRSR